MRQLLLVFILLFFFATVHSQHVGIGTASPQARLHVTDSSVLFQGPLLIPASTMFAPPASGAGVRFMWYPQKGSLRAGYVSSTNWDKDSIGLGSIALGYNVKAKGDYSTSLGYNTNAKGIGCTCLGANTTAANLYSTSMGFGSNAIGSVSTSMGYGTAAFGGNSTSMGYLTSAIGPESTSMGAVTTASGAWSTSMGIGTYASGLASTSMGYYTNAKSDNSVVIGIYNDTTGTNRLFEIGNGTADNQRNNVFTVLDNGNAGFNTTSPGARVHLVKTNPLNTLYHANAGLVLEDSLGVLLQFTNKAAFQSGIISGSELTTIRSAILFPGDSSISFRSGGNTNRMTIESNGNVGIGTTAPSQKLHVVGNILASGTITPSDFRYKTDIKKLEDPLGKLAAINGVSYYYKTGSFPEMGFSNSRQVGVIAQEVEAVLPEVVVTDANGYKAVDYAKLVPLLIEGMKAQQQEITELKKLVEQLLRK